MTTASTVATTPKKTSRVFHAIWITAAILFVTSPDGEGATKSVPARELAAWFLGQ
ncbi:hypothetical protein [Nibricoccus aquaticus]|uniref:hypothetical protein n=1 Tax=Nibricoccus aquaticus TaxID=2576891 RepID=UPI0015860815|nr:hypothetical protein [Nibricoccus aquaticus]